MSKVRYLLNERRAKSLLISMENEVKILTEIRFKQSQYIKEFEQMAMASDSVIFKNWYESASKELPDLYHPRFDVFWIDCKIRGLSRSTLQKILLYSEVIHSERSKTLKQHTEITQLRSRQLKLCSAIKTEYCPNMKLHID